MRIGIDISSIIYGTGVSKYTNNLVKALVRNFPEEEFVFYGGSLRNNKLLNSFSKSVDRNVESSINPIPPKLQSILFNKLHIPIEIFLKKVDIFHSWDWYTPGSNKASLVTTIHDLTSIKYPQDTNPEITAQHKRSLQWVKKEAKAIIAVSEATKKDAIELLGIDEQKIHVIYEALPEEQKIKENKIISKKVKEKFKLNLPYFITVASQEPRKNLNRIIKAFKPFNKKYNLVLVGKSGFDQIENHEGVIKTGYVSDDELAALYKNASCMVYTSLYEGFGLPILEAFYHKTPVVTSNISSMPEVSGNAAVLVNPLSFEEITKGIEKAISQRSKFTDNGSKQLKKFSWDKVAKETMKIYKMAYVK
ncbi:glycosyltransferase family 4 protein [Patescibacteria group bacterium]